VINFDFDPSKRDIQVTTQNYLCPSCNQKLPMEILSKGIHIKSERVIKFTEDYDVEEAVEDNWRILLVACVSCRIKMILENYFVEMTDEDLFYYEQQYGDASYASVFSARNRLHVLMPKSDLVSMSWVSMSPHMPAITHLLEKFILNSSELITEEWLLDRSRRNLEEILANLKDNKTIKAFQFLCETTESLLKAFCQETLKNPEIKNKTFGSLIHSIFSEEVSESSSHRRRRDTLFYNLLDINETFCSVKQGQICAEDVQISYEYLNYVLLQFSSLMDYLKLNIPFSPNSGIG
jgi:hypothetical protein